MPVLAWIQAIKASVRLRRPGSFLLLAQKKRTKENGLPRHYKLATGKYDGIFRHGIHAVAKNGARPARRPPGLRFAGLPAFLRTYIVEDVIPAKAGIHFDLDFRSTLWKTRSTAKWIPAFAGMTNCAEARSKAVNRL